MTGATVAASARSSRSLPTLLFRGLTSAVPDTEPLRRPGQAARHTGGLLRGSQERAALEHGAAGSIDPRDQAGLGAGLNAVALTSLALARARLGIGASGMMSVMTSVRTQVYLEPVAHQRLRRLAAERGTSLTDLVRVAVARFLEREAPADDPIARLAARGLPPETELSIAERLRARAGAFGTRADAADVSAEDAALADALMDSPRPGP